MIPVNSKECPKIFYLGHDYFFNLRTNYIQEEENNTSQLPLGILAQGNWQSIRDEEEYYDPP